MFWPSNYTLSFDGDKHWEVLANTVRVTVQKWSDFISHWNLLRIDELRDSRRTACSWGFTLFKQEKHKLLKYTHRAWGLKTGCEVFCSQNHKHKSRLVLVKATAFILLTAYCFLVLSLLLAVARQYCCPYSFPHYTITDVSIQTKPSQWFKEGS